jgi:ferrous iron transport protein B
LKKEYGNKMMFTSFIYQLVLAWIISFVVYTLGNVFTGSFEGPKFVELAVTAGILAIAFTILYKKFSSKSSGCSSCSGCPHENSCSTQPETNIQELNKKEA